MEGANDSLNLHDAATLQRLPQLTSTPDERKHEVESPVIHSQDIKESTVLRTSVSRNERSQSDLAAVYANQTRVQSEMNSGFSVLTDENQEKVHQSLSKKNRCVLPEKPAEDLVVLSFSSSSGEQVL